MPTVTWARVDPSRRAAVVEAAEAEFGAHGFSQGSLNVIARRAGVAKGSLFQYFADKRDLLRLHRRHRQPAGALLHGGPHPRARPEQAVLRIPDRPPRHLGGVLRRSSARPRTTRRGDPEVDTDARVSVRTVIHRHYLEVLRPLVRDARIRGDLRADCDTDALLSLLLMIFPHMALAPYVRGMDPILGLDEPTPEQPALAVRRLVAVLADAFSSRQPSPT